MFSLVILACGVWLFVFLLIGCLGFYVLLWLLCYRF